MLKKISTMAVAALISMPGLAMAAGDSDRVADLEKQMTEMTRAFNAKMEAMQAEITALKSKQVPAETVTAPAAATASAADWAKKVSLNGEVRVRGYDLQNMWTFNDANDVDNWDVFRIKGSLKATVKATDDVTAVVQLTDQTYGEGVSDYLDNQSGKVFLDNAYIEARNMFHLPVDLTFGRQNLIYGSGFVLLDGQSQLASTAIYFDGVKLRYHLTDTMYLDGLYMKDQENRRDNRDNVLDANNNILTEDDITLSGAYFTAPRLPFVGKTELYVLNRNDEGIKKDIWMYGGRVSNKLDMGFDYSLEAALQRGDAGNGLTGAVQDQEAWGTKLDAGYTFDVALRPRLFAGYTYLSGDDPNTAGDYEGWDVFYGGWPQWGDLLAWVYVNVPFNAIGQVDPSFGSQSTVTGEAVYSNLQMMTIGANADLMKDLTALVSYSKLNFNETVAGVDDDFGDYYQLSLKYRYNKQLSFSLYAALLAPGDAFNNVTPKDDATEVFWETDYRF